MPEMAVADNQVNCRAGWLFAGGLLLAGCPDASGVWAACEWKAAGLPTARRRAVFVEKSA
jgi:hypothetical protein